MHQWFFPGTCQSIITRERIYILCFISPPTQGLYIAQNQTPVFSSEYNHSDRIPELKHHEYLRTTFSVFHPFLQDPEVVPVPLTFHSYQAVPMWIGLVRSAAPTINAGTGSLPGKRLSCWTPQWIKPDLPFPLRQISHSCADIATTDLNSPIIKDLWTNKKGHLHANTCWSPCWKYTQLWSQPVLPPCVLCSRSAITTLLFSHVRHSPGSITAPTNNPKKINDPNEKTKYLVVSPFDFISLTS